MDNVTGIESLKSLLILSIHSQTQLRKIVKFIGKTLRISYDYGVIATATITEGFDHSMITDEETWSSVWTGIHFDSNFNINGQSVVVLQTSN